MRITVLLLKSPARSGISEGDWCATPESSGIGASTSDNLASPEIDLPDPNKGVLVVQMKSPARSDISEGEWLVIPESSGTGVSISENPVSPEFN